MSNLEDVAPARMLLLNATSSKRFQISHVRPVCFCTLPSSARGLSRRLGSDSATFIRMEMRSAARLGNKYGDLRLFLRASTWIRPPSSVHGCADEAISSVLLIHNCLHEVLLSNTPWLVSTSVKFLVTPPEVGSSHSNFFMFFQAPPRPLAGRLRIDVLIKRALPFQVEASPPGSNPHHARMLSSSSIWNRSRLGSGTINLPRHRGQKIPFPVPFSHDRLRNARLSTTIVDDGVHHRCARHRHRRMPTRMNSRVVATGGSGDSGVQSIRRWRRVGGGLIHLTPPLLIESASDSFSSKHIHDLLGLTSLLIRALPPS